MKRYYGVIPEPSYVRDFELDAVCGSSDVELPKEYALPVEKVIKVKNQLETYGCVSFAITSALEYRLSNELGSYVELSPGYIYGNPDCRDGYDGKGMYDSTAVAGVKKCGVVENKHFDIIGEMTEIQTLVEERADLKDLAYKIVKGYIALNYADKKKRLREIKRALYEYQIPLVAVSYDFFGESHAIIIYGWNDKDEFLFQNSWGEEYKNKGRSIIPFAHINASYLFLTEDLSLSFEDVKETDWFYDEVKHGVFSGLISGTSKTEFSPYEYLIRGDAAVILARLLNKVEPSVNAFLKTKTQKGEKVKKISFKSNNTIPFIDVAPKDYWTSSIKKCYSNGIIKGTINSLFNPTGQILRCELAAIAVRTIELILHEINNATGLNIQLPMNEETDFEDVSSSKWYTENIEKACGYGLMKGDGNGQFRPEEPIIRAEATAVFVRLFGTVDEILKQIR